MKNRKKSDRKIGDILFRICNYVLLICFAVICLYPFYYIFLYSISDPAAAELKGIFLLPVEPSLHSYKQLLEGGTIFYGILVSASRAVIGTCVTVTCCSFFAYLVSKKEMPGSVNAPAVNTFLKKNKIGERVIAVFTCSGGGDQGKCIQKLADKLPNLHLTTSLTDRVNPKSSENEEKLKEFSEKYREMAYGK